MKNNIKWKVSDLDELSIKIKVDANHVHECVTIADVYIMSGNLGEEVPKAVANAKLIASAPEMYSALLKAKVALLNVTTYSELIPDSVGSGVSKAISEINKILES